MTHGKAIAISAAQGLADAAAGRT